MKKSPLFLFLFLSVVVFAQKKDSVQLKRTVFEAPKEIAGFKVRYATLSKGRYQEFFSNDTIQQIGSVLFNRVTGEVVSEVVKDSLYFPADVVSRWWSVDPLAKKYPELSPYVFVENNPLLNIDPDGRDVIIYYKDENNKQQQFVLNGKTDLSALPNNEFVKSAVAAYQYMQSKGTGKNFISAVSDSEVKIKMQESKGTDGSFYDDKNHTINWLPLGGYETANGTVLSPSTVLEHEADHAYDHAKNATAHEKRSNTKDEQYGTAEEKRVITGTEQKTARSFGELQKGKITRNEHHAGTRVITTSPTSNTINRPATYQYLMKLHNKMPYYDFNKKAEKFKNK
ncbi:MAG: M91 family zinc metallopeptidase [Thermoflexibacter sp.]|jgi:hypothetical protein|nr:M91 family zinc metallopeptidase [Thermoflexibacter sp.]